MTTQSIEIAYRIRGLTRRLYNATPNWPDCTLEQKDDFEVILRISEDRLTPGTDLNLTIAHIDGRVRQLVLAWELQFGCRLELHRANIAWPRFPEENGRAMLGSMAVLSDHPSAHVIPPTPPAEMPQAPFAAERWIKTLAEAGDFGAYVEEQLRRHYLIIEELWGKYRFRFDATAQEKYGEIKLVRHFVSHAECHGEEVLKFISSQLPSAVVAGTIEPTVRFDRNVEHRNFVARYEISSGEIARKLVQFAIHNLTSSS